MIKVWIVEVETCGDWYCTGHGDGQKVLADKLKDGTFKVFGKIYRDPKDVFKAGIRDIVEVRSYKENI